MIDFSKSKLRNFEPPITEFSLNVELLIAFVENGWFMIDFSESKLRIFEPSITEFY